MSDTKQTTDNPALAAQGVEQRDPGLLGVNRDTNATDAERTERDGICYGEGYNAGLRRAASLVRRWPRVFQAALVADAIESEIDA